MLHPDTRTAAAIKLIKPNDFIVFFIVFNLASKIFVIESDFTVNMYSDLLVGRNINSCKCLAVHFPNPVLNIADTSLQNRIECLVVVSDCGATGRNLYVVTITGEDAGDCSTCCCDQAVIGDVFLGVGLSVPRNARNTKGVTDVANTTCNAVAVLAT